MTKMTMFLKGAFMNDFKVLTYNFDPRWEEIKGLEGIDYMKQPLFPRDEEHVPLDTSLLLLLEMEEGNDEVWEEVKRLQSIKKELGIVLILKKKNFDDLYTAFEYHVDEVIVEDVSVEILSERIMNVIRALTMKQKQRRDRIRQEEHEFSRRQEIMARVLQNTLKKPEEVKVMLPEINERYHLNLSEHKFQIIVISANRGDLYGKDSLFIKRATLLALEYISSAQEIVLSTQNPYGLIGVINYPTYYNKEVLRKEMKQLWNALNALQAEFGEFDVSIGVGEVVENIPEIAVSLFQASMAQEYRMFSKERVLFAEDLGDVDQPLRRFIPDLRLKELSRYITLGDEMKLHEWFEEFYLKYETLFHDYPQVYARFCWDCYLGVRGMEQSKTIDMFPEWKFFSLQHIFDGHKRMQQLEVILSEVCHMIRLDENKGHEIAMRALAYMQVHFREPISLEDVAENCGISVSYFSRKFKEQTGENYIEALTEIRMKEAKRLLEETDASILSIMDMVGYMDDKHFRKIFMKHVGMSPREYRKQTKSLLSKEKA